jgi:hypothetical protein
MHHPAESSQLRGQQLSTQKEYNLDSFHWPAKAAVSPPWGTQLRHPVASHDLIRAAFPTQSDADSMVFIALQNNLTLLRAPDVATWPSTRC